MDFPLPGNLGSMLVKPWEMQPIFRRRGQFIKPLETLSERARYFGVGVSLVHKKRGWGISQSEKLCDFKNRPRDSISILTINVAERT